MAHENPVRGDLIKKALDSLQFLGTSLQLSIIEYLEKRGNRFDEQNSYSLSKIEKDIAAIFGPDAASLLVERLRRALETTDT